jgi:chromosome segregation ATPase
VNWTPELLSALIAAAVAFMGGYATLRKAKSDAVAAATGIYRELCASQQHRIDMLTARIEALEHEKDELVSRYTQEIEGMEAQLDDLREALAGKQREIARLQERVTELEGENAKLKAELALLCASRGTGARKADA